MYHKYDYITKKELIYEGVKINIDVINLKNDIYGIITIISRSEISRSEFEKALEYITYNNIDSHLEMVYRRIEYAKGYVDAYLEMAKNIGLE